MSKIDYNASSTADTKGTTTLTAATEIEVLKTINPTYLAKSQVSAFFNITLGSSTGVSLKYYVLKKAIAVPTANDWTMLGIKDPVTGIIGSIPTVLDSSSPTVNANIDTVEEIPVPACYGFRVTATAATANATLNEATLVVRDN